MSKLISEADKLLEKGKIPEAVEKLKAAQQAEPLNQLAASKLADIYIEDGDAVGAAKVYVALAERLSEAGKSQVAIAIFKRAIELTPDDVNLKVKFAIECEAVGKLGDAQAQAQLALQFFLRRKKYFDATNLFPLLARILTKDEKIRLAWIDTLQFSQADQKIVHLLVALCGPPGLASQEFPVGGDPALLTDRVYEALKRLVAFYPRDPKIAYAVAWAAHRRGRMKDAYGFLRECLVRDPDFCLALLLYARILAEQQKLNESLFVYKHMKDRVISDKSVELPKLNHLIESFLEKNGWITFTDGMGVEEPSATAFLEGFAGKKVAPPPAAKTSSEPKVVESSAAPEKLTPDRVVPQVVEAKLEEPVPAEIELSLSESGPAEAGMELLSSGDQSSQRGAAKAAASPAAPPVQAQVPEPEPVAAPVVSTPSPVVAVVPRPAPAAAPSPSPAAVSAEETPLVQNTKSVEFTSILKPDQLAPQGIAESAAELVKSDGQTGSIVLSAEKNLGEIVPPSEPKLTFNPLENSADKKGVEGAKVIEGEKTVEFNPVDLVVATKRPDVPDVATKIGIQPADPVEEVLVLRESALPSSAQEIRKIWVDGEETKLFSPVEAVQAGVESRNKLNVSLASEAPKKAEDPALDAASILLSEHISADEKIDIVTFREAEGAPAPAFTPDPAQSAKDVVLSSEDQATMVFQPDYNEILPAEVAPVGSALPLVESDPVALTAVEEIPATALEAPKDAATPEQPDLGDDLLEGPTKIFVPEKERDATQHFLSDIKKDLLSKERSKVTDVEMLLKKAERYVAKRNYYLARKVLRHCLALGGNEAKIKERLRDIRKMELPEGLYNSISSDQVAKEASAEILDRLEHEFDLGRSEEADGGELGETVDAQIDDIFLQADQRTILDFGVALHEMGLFRQAEALFSRMVDEFPEFAFDAYYLSAVSKFARKDYAGAASILKKLSADGVRSEREKIQVYYALGELFEKMRRPDRSQEFYRKVASLDSNYRNIRHKLEK